MAEHLYRYRPIDAVLDKFHELENQQIYFSTPADLNDPLEGFKDLFWSGDRIVWRNFLKHYILCLQEIAVSAFVTGAEFDEKTLENLVFSAPDSLPDAPVRPMYAKLSTAFLESETAKIFLDIVSSRPLPIRRNELTAYLRALHPFALDAMCREFIARGLLPPPLSSSVPPLDQLRVSAENLMRFVPHLREAADQPERVSEVFFAAGERSAEQLDPIFEHNHPEAERRGIVFFTRYFPAAYVRALDKLVHRDWYVACFSASATNTNMWANYAGGHRGVCLKFRTPLNAAGLPTLNLNRAVAVSGSRSGHEVVFGDVPHPLQKLSYQPNYPAIDFFRSLGTVNHSYMDGFWYRADDGTFSTCRDAIYADEAAWRENYWKTFTESALCKTPEWSHEQEHRIVAHSLFDMREPKDRTFKYRFEDLAGIVFGSRTSVADKLRIMQIIGTKCAAISRTDFEFSEMCYSTSESRFLLMPLKLLNVSPVAEPRRTTPDAA